LEGNFRTYQALQGAAGSSGASQQKGIESLATAMDMDDGEGGHALYGIDASNITELLG
jgi:hypothetical protein